jgi:hypothetical protein
MADRDRMAVVAGLPAAVAVAAGAVAAGLVLLQAAAPVVATLAVASVAGLDAGAAGQVVFLLVSAWVAALAWSVGWPPAAPGTQQAIDVVARVLLEPGDRVAVEAPGYGPPRRLLASLTAAASGGCGASTPSATGGSSSSSVTGSPTT